MKTDFACSPQWLRSFVTILLAFVGLILTLVVLSSLPHGARATGTPYTASGIDSGTAAGESGSRTAMVATSDGNSSSVSTDPGSRSGMSGGVVIYEGSVLKVTQILTRVVVENISEDPVTIRVSWDGCDPHGTGGEKGCDSDLDSWVTPQERVDRLIKNHYSVQIWAWGNSDRLLDSCDLPVVPPSPTLSTPPIIPPARLAIYYAWPSAVNGCAHDLDCATDAFAQFNLVVFGDGLEHPSHVDHTKTITIINNLEAGDTDVYGYIDLGVTTQNLDLITITTYVDEWAEMSVSGIFYDNAGQDFGVTRTRLVSAVDYVHNHTQTLTVFINAWNPDDVLSGTTPLTRGDWLLAESHPVSDCQCVDPNFWWQKSQKLDQYRKEPGIRVATISTCDDPACTDWPDYPSFRAALWATYLLGLDGFGFTNPQYSASGGNADHICPLPAMSTHIGTLYTGPLTGPISIDDVPAYSRPTNKGVIYISGGDDCDGAFLFRAHLPIILRSIVLCERSALKAVRTESEIIVENISNGPTAIRVSWDGCDPYGTGPPECDSYLDNWVTPQERIHRPIKNHYSVQIWAWDMSRTLIDSCDEPLQFR